MDSYLEDGHIDSNMYEALTDRDSVFVLKKDDKDTIEYSSESEDEEEEIDYGLIKYTIYERLKNEIDSKNLPFLQHNDYINFATFLDN